MEINLTKARKVITSKTFIIVLAIVIVVTAALLYIFGDWDKTKMPAIDDVAVKKEKDSLLAVNQKIMSQNYVLQNQIDSMEGVIANRGTKIQKVTEYVEKIIYKWDTASVAEKQRFFTDRYLGQ